MLIISREQGTRLAVSLKFNLLKISTTRRYSVPTSSAIARMWYGSNPQHPPIYLTPKSLACRAYLCTSQRVSFRGSSAKKKQTIWQHWNCGARPWLKAKSPNAKFCEFFVLTRIAIRHAVNIALVKQDLQSWTKVRKQLQFYAFHKFCRKNQCCLFTNPCPLPTPHLIQCWKIKGIVPWRFQHCLWGGGRG